MKELRSRKLGDLPLRSKLSFRIQAFNLLAVSLQQQFSVSPGDPRYLWGDCVVKIIFIIRLFVPFFSFILSWVYGGIFHSLHVMWCYKSSYEILVIFLFLDILKSCKNLNGIKFLLLFLYFEKRRYFSLKICYLC